MVGKSRYQKVTAFAFEFKWEKEEEGLEDSWRKNYESSTLTQLGSGWRMLCRKYYMHVLTFTTIITVLARKGMIFTYDVVQYVFIRCIYYHQFDQQLRDYIQKIYTDLIVKCSIRIWTTSKYCKNNSYLQITRAIVQWPFNRDN